MAFGDDDLAYMCSDVFSEPVEFGTERLTGILDSEDVVVTDTMGQAVPVRTTTLLVPKTHFEDGGKLSMLQTDDVLMVAGRSYSVRYIPDYDDGRMVSLHLATVIP